MTFEHLRVGLLVFVIGWIVLGYLLLWYFAKDRRKSHVVRRLGKRMCEKGEDVAVTLTLTPPAYEGELAPKDIVLCFDESGSMGSGPGSPLQETIRAGQVFARRCPEPLQLGVVRFSGQAQIASPLGVSRKHTVQAIQTLGRGGRTAIDLALDSCGDVLHRGRQGVPKVIILLSDGGSPKKKALAARQRLIEAFPDIAILCVGLRNRDVAASYFHEDMLRALADRDEHCLIMEDAADLGDLYDFLSQYVSHGMALKGIVEETLPVPHPFVLKEAGDLFPIGVVTQQTTDVTWALPSMQPEKSRLRYRLVPQCPGWHRITEKPGRVHWQMPDDSRMTFEGPASQRVLVLWENLGWAWPILNPLFFICFGWLVRLFCHPLRPSGSKPKAVEPLPVASLPEPLPLPQPLNFQIETQPALVIGLGDSGAWALTYLQQTANDRGVAKERLALLEIDTRHASHRVPTQLGETTLSEQQRLTIGCDLRPLLEELRGQDEPGTRNWVPWREWLGQATGNQTTRSLDDRRKARFSLLHHSEQVDIRLQSVLADLREVADQNQQKVAIYLTGAFEDPAFSGLAAEIAHMCAGHGQSVSLICVRDASHENREAEVAAFARELERLYLLSGETILSDRRQPPASAKRLFDKLVIHEQAFSNGKQAGKAASHLLWPLVAYPEFANRLQVIRPTWDQVQCWAIESESYQLPMATIWRWVVTRTLSKSILMSWMGLEKQDGEWRLPLSDKENYQPYVDKFWTGEQVKRPMPHFVKILAKINRASNPVSEMYLASHSLWPDEHYQRQVEHWRVARRDLFYYCEAWVHTVLSAEQQQGRWGLVVVLAALRPILEQVAQVSSRFETYAGNDSFLKETRPLRNVVMEVAELLERIETQLSHWVKAMVGPLIDFQVPAPEDQIWLTGELERQRLLANQHFETIPQQLQEQAMQHFDHWWETVGSQLIQHLHIDLTQDERRDVAFQLRLDSQIIRSPEQLLEQLCSWLEGYQNIVMQWPLVITRDDRQHTVPPSHESLAIGALAPELFPDVTENLNDRDPHFAGVYTPRRKSLSQALRYSQLPTDDLPFVWPEEQQAQHLAKQLQHQLKERVAFENPRLIDLLRYPKRLQAFLSEIAAGRVEEKAGELVVTRNGHTYVIGQSPSNLEPNKAMARFEKAARNLVVFQSSLSGEPIPDLAEELGLFDGMTLQKQPVVRSVQESPKWREYKRLICALLKGEEHG